MSPKEAFKKVCDFVKIRPVVMDCRELYSYFGFYLAPPGSDPNKPQFVGGSMLLVNKLTGEVKDEEDVPSLKKKNWKPVPIDQFNKG